MLGENIRELRKKKGYSQETLAEQLKVVRQTVSKWEQGLSVPDAEMLTRIAELFEVPVNELLGDKISENPAGTDLNEVANQLAILNERLANQSRRRRRILKTVLISIAAVFLLSILVNVAACVVYNFNHSSGITTMTTTTELKCTLNGEEILEGE